MTEMPYLCWAFLYTSTGVNSYNISLLIPISPSHTEETGTKQYKFPAISSFAFSSSSSYRSMPATSLSDLAHIFVRILRFRHNKTPVI